MVISVRNIKMSMQFKQQYVTTVEREIILQLRVIFRTEGLEARLEQIEKISKKF